MKELQHFVDQYYQLPETSLLKWIVRMINLGTVYLVLNVREQKSIFVLMWDPHLNIEQLQTSLYDPDT